MSSKSSSMLVRGLCRSLTRLNSSSSSSASRRIVGTSSSSVVEPQVEIDAAAVGTCEAQSHCGWRETRGPLRATLPTAGAQMQHSRCVSGSSSSQQALGVQVDLAQGDISYDYLRRSENGGLTHKALLVDAAGTLLIPSQPAAKVYREIGLKYGVTYTEDEILARYRWAYAKPWCHSILRYVDDGRPFWQYVVEQATGCSDKRYFEELYQYYTTAKAWHVEDKEAGKVFEALRNAGVKLAVVSNFDTRLRPLMKDLDCDHWFDALAVSAEVEAEKPNPIIFLHACEVLGVKPEDTVHVGDDQRNDIWGARDAGCDAWLWGSDVHTFREVAERIGVEVEP